MIEGENKVLQAFLGTLFTWGLTAAGSSLVFLFSTGKFSSNKVRLKFLWIETSVLTFTANPRLPSRIFL